MIGFTMLAKIQKIMKSKFMSRSKVVLIGTVIAQAITFGTSFVITAFYTPEDLGLLGTLTALISIVAGSLCFRLEVAVIQAKDEDAIDVFTKATILGGIACTIFSLVCFLLPFEFASKITMNLIPFVAWCWGYCFFFNSKQLPFKFNNLEYASYGNIWRSAFTFVFQLIAGLIKPSFGSLVVGRISSDYVGGVVHCWKYLKGFSLQRAKSHWMDFIRRHSDFLIYMAPQHLCFALSNNIIIFYIERGYGLMIVGFFALAQRLIMAPIEVIGSTIANVTMQRFGELRDNKDHLKTFYWRVIIFSLTISIVTGAGIWVSADYVIPLLGSKWAGATSMVKSLVPFFISYQFNMPTTNFLRFVNKTRLQLILEIIELTIKVALLSFVSWEDSNTMIQGYGIASLGFSFLRTVIVFKAF